MIELWARAMRRTCPEATRGLETDLRVYLDFEHVQSVFPDVMRASLKLPNRPTESDFAVAADKVCRAVRLARETLDLGESPADQATVETALRKWHESERRGAHACGHGEGAREWDDLWTHRRRRRGLGGQVARGMLSGMLTAPLTWVAMSW